MKTRHWIMLIVLKNVYFVKCIESCDAKSQCCHTFDNCTLVTLVSAGHDHRREVAMVGRANHSIGPDHAIIIINIANFCTLSLQQIQTIFRDTFPRKFSLYTSMLFVITWTIQSCKSLILIEKHHSCQLRRIQEGNNFWLSRYLLEDNVKQIKLASVNW